MRIALLGSAPSSIDQAPWKDQSWQDFASGKTQAYPPAKHATERWELWGCSPGLYGRAERMDRWFEVHRWEPGAQWFSPEYCQWLRDFKGPVYTGCTIPEIPNHTVYPIARVEAEFSAYFLTSSLSLMFALAIMEIEQHRANKPNRDTNTIDDDVIGLWGVDMAAAEEYGYQRAGCQFFVLEALRRGIGVYLPPESDLLRPMPVYGMIEHSHQYIKMTAHARELNMRIQRHQQVIAEETRAMTLVQGALGQLHSHVNTWTSPYGLPAGIVLSHKPGTGLGSGIADINGEPMPSVHPFAWPANETANAANVPCATNNSPERFDGIVHIDDIMNELNNPK